MKILPFLPKNMHFSRDALEHDDTYWSFVYNSYVFIQNMRLYHRKMVTEQKYMHPFDAFRIMLHHRGATKAGDFHLG